MAGNDISRLLQRRVLEALTDAGKWETNEKQIKEILFLNPGYALEYFIRSFTAKQHIRQGRNRIRSILRRKSIFFLNPQFPSCGWRKG